MHPNHSRLCRLECPTTEIVRLYCSHHTALSQLQLAFLLHVPVGVAALPDNVADIAAAAAAAVFALFLSREYLADRYFRSHGAYTWNLYDWQAQPLGKVAAKEDETDGEHRQYCC